MDFNTACIFFAILGVGVLNAFMLACINDNLKELMRIIVNRFVKEK